MPDLFHFNQDLAHKAGVVIGKAWSKSLKAYEEIKARSKKEENIFYSQRKPLEDNYFWQDNNRRRYQNGIHWISKAIHPFDINGKFEVSNEIRRVIGKGIIMVEEALISSRALSTCLKEAKDEGRSSINLCEVEKKKQEDGLDVKILEGLFNQIPSIVQGVGHWQEWTKQRLDKFIESSYQANIFPQVKSVKVKSYLLYTLLPLVYWQTVLQRLAQKKKNERLRKYYQKIIERCTEKQEVHPLSTHLVKEQKQICYDWCVEIARSFQRSSSQVEGRNGYLAFVHKANRGIPNQRLQVLTVVHNFDIRGLDGKTPAERLFGKIIQQDSGRNFPDLFEYLMQNVTSFPEPRRRKPQPPKTLSVRA